MEKLRQAKAFRELCNLSLQAVHDLARKRGASIAPMALVEWEIGQRKLGVVGQRVLASIYSKTLKRTVTIDELLKPYNPELLQRQLALAEG